jgi:hypothetical protein
MNLISSKGKSFAVMTKGPLVFLENGGRTEVDIGLNGGDLVDVEYRFDPNTNIAGYLHFHCSGRTWVVHVYNEDIRDISKDSQTIEIPCSPKRWEILVLEANRHYIVFTMV